MKKQESSEQRRARLRNERSTFKFERTLHEQSRANDLARKRANEEKFYARKRVRTHEDYYWLK